MGEAMKKKQQEPPTDQSALMREIDITKYNSKGFRIDQRAKPSVVHALTTNEKHKKKKKEAKMSRRRNR
jgi:hypothetical protein